LSFSRHFLRAFSLISRSNPEFYWLENVSISNSLDDFHILSEIDLMKSI